ncbi:MAG: hypothetical protein U1F53_21880 [Burkholderiaceae bacterium]
MCLQSVCLALAAGTALALASTAQAATPVDFSKLAPKQQAHLAAIQAKQRQASPLYNYDIRPPVLKKVHVGGTVNAGRKYAQAVVSLVANDNLTGVHQVSVTLMSPSGQSAYNSWYGEYDSTRNELQIGVDMSDATENGTWRLYSVTVGDSNNNITHYDEAQLAALGSTTFTVTGAAGDFSAPEALAGGINLTPTVSRSTPPRGMLPGNPARIGVQLNLADVGAAGIRSASMEFCLDGGYWDCFSVSGDVSVRGKSAVLLTMGGHVYEYATLGNYTPTTLYIYDQSGNSRSYYSDWGDDLNSLLDNPVITITE